MCKVEYIYFIIQCKLKKKTINLHTCVTIMCGVQYMLKTLSFAPCHKCLPIFSSILQKGS